MKTKKFTHQLEKTARTYLVNTMTSYLEKNPEDNVTKIFALLKNTIQESGFRNQIVSVEEYYENNPAIRAYIHRFLKETNSKCLQKFVSNFLVNESWVGEPKRYQYFEEQGVKIPFVLLISPTMRCNLRCQGCYAAEYGAKDELSKDEVERIIKEARDLGIYYIIVLGGEPFFYTHMLDLYEKYNDMIFMPFTNGTLINEEIADRLVKSANVLPMFSLEGYAKETDQRRNKGVFDKVVHAMSLLKERGVLFGVSTAINKNNYDTVLSDEFIDFLIEQGSKMSWYFLYMPVGDKPDFNLMLSAKQRIDMGNRINELRTKKPYFAVDFFNDAPYVGGCIAGKYYCHINASGEVEPCIFSHFACDNIRGKSLLEVLSSSYFKKLRENQPYNDNMLLPCWMIDNPEMVRKLVKETGAHPTEEGAERMLSDVAFITELEQLAKELKPLADEEWETRFNKKGNDKMAKCK